MLVWPGTLLMPLQTDLVQIWHGVVQHPLPSGRGDPRRIYAIVSSSDLPLNPDDLRRLNWQNMKPT